MLFTHFGISGPLVLSASAMMRKGTPQDYRMEIDLKPGLTPEKLAYAVDMGLLAMIQLSMRYVEHYAPLAELKEAAWHQLTILDKGIRE
mgnify:FL=1